MDPGQANPTDVQYREYFLHICGQIGDVLKTKRDLAVVPRSAWGVLVLRCEPGEF